MSLEYAPIERALETSPHNLPLQMNQFLGREQEMSALRGLLTATRLLTLTGAGGSGKTRLALQVATDLLEEFAHGVWWVELAALSDSLLVLQAVASAMDISEQIGCTLMETLSTTLRSKHLLLVLDNCEHLLTACVQLIETLLRTCPRLRVLVTSREPLTITGETVWQVLPFSVPDISYPLSIQKLMTYEAVQLFIERARSILPSFSLTQENAPAVVQVCRQLDGLPLAIELAAVRLQVLTVEQIAARLDDYRLLTRGSRSALPRQQTLRAAMDWSYNLLSVQEQALFRHLSVFAGSFSLEAAEAICADLSCDVLDSLSLLIEKSMVLMKHSNSETRYRLLEMMRQYGQEKLRQAGEMVSTMHHHYCEWYTRFVQRPRFETVDGLPQIEWLHRLEVEYENIQMALAWLLERGDMEAGLRLGSSMWYYWLYQGHLAKGRDVMTRILEHLSEQTPVRVKALVSVGLLAFSQSDYVRAIILLKESLYHSHTLSDKEEAIAYTLIALGTLTCGRGDYQLAVTLYEESLLLLRKLDDKWGMVLALSGCGLALLSLREYRRARALCEESLALARTLGSLQHVAGSLTTLAMAVLGQGDFARARGLYEENLAIWQKLRDRGASASLHALVGRVAQPNDSYKQVKKHHDERLLLSQELEEKVGVASAVEKLASVAYGQGEPLRAARLCSAAETLREIVDTSLPPSDHALYKDTVTAIRDQLRVASSKTAWTEERAFTREQAIAEVQQAKEQEQSISTSQSTMRRVPPGSTQVPASRGNFFGLTARELAVLRLVAQGLTYVQIADALSISPRTADAHLRSIYGKLGVNSRHAATHIALQEKLV